MNVKKWKEKKDDERLRGDTQDKQARMYRNRSRSQRPRNLSAHLKHKGKEELNS